MTRVHARTVQLLSLGRYPEYVVDLLASRAQFLCLGLMHDFCIGKHARVRGLPIISMVRGSTIRIGDHAAIVSRSRNTALGVNHPVVLRTLRPTAQIRVGDHLRASGVILCAASAITIGHRVMMGANTVITDTDFHSLDPRVRASGDDQEQAETRPVCIGSDVFLGCNALILKGVSIGDGAVIGAGAVVTRDVPQGAIAAGNPARVVKHMMCR